MSREQQLGRVRVCYSQLLLQLQGSLQSCTVSKKVSKGSTFCLTASASFTSSETVCSPELFMNSCCFS
ncbi:hypothetical protein AV530_018756 [Patagioenas fasciata monilis]|uniref:Uncharacterized protein n=1 Tax=Patagioenas fasciata monilis TaxID=372326 RepID=A0A1V4JJN6_PATFA|nr:hypothetical protein AV530_018756 [Patagioenas fasciata monilis]